MIKVFSQKRMILQIIISLGLVFMMTEATACGLGKETQKTAISVAKDGTVSMQIIEPFDKTYYDGDELKQRILTEVADYNRNTLTGDISVEKIEVEDQSAKVIMRYAGCEDFALFNKNVFYVGSIAKAQEAGFDLNIVLSGTEDSLETIGMTDMRNMEDYSILITDCADSVTIEGKAAYISDNVSVSKNKKTITRSQDTEEPAYVVFR